jgi:hypothetical protein
MKENNTNNLIFWSFYAFSWSSSNNYGISINNMSMNNNWNKKSLKRWNKKCIYNNEIIIN